MFAFGHLTFTFYILYKYIKNWKISGILALLVFIPDVDLFLMETHRGITHTIFIIPIFLIAVFIASSIFNFKINSKEMIIISVLLYIGHVIPDVVSGKIPIVPNYYIGLNIGSLAEYDLLFGLPFYFLILKEFWKKE